MNKFLCRKRKLCDCEKKNNKRKYRILKFVLKEKAIMKIEKVVEKV